MGRSITRSKPATAKELINMLIAENDKRFCRIIDSISQNRDRIRELEKPGSTTKYWLKK